jgi:hypothetical protein
MRENLTCEGYNGQSDFSEMLYCNLFWNTKLNDTRDVINQTHKYNFILILLNITYDFTLHYRRRFMYLLTLSEFYVTPFHFLNVYFDELW